MKTTGWEVTLAYNDRFQLAGAPFNLTARFLLSDTRSWITRFDNPTNLLTQYYEGQELGEIWGLQSDGLFTSYDEIAKLDESEIIPWGALDIVPGWPKYVDLNGDNRITKGLTLDDPKDLSIIGNSSPRYRFGFNLLGDHFSPVVALVAPAYWLVPHVWVLVVVQAGLIGLTTFLIARVVARRLGQGAGLLIGAIYALAWGTQWLALFDFHEVAFALPLVALCYLRLLEGRDRSAVLWALPLMLVKEDSVFLLLGLALVLLARRRFRLAALTSLYAVGTFAVIVGVVIPRISYYGRYTYWSSSAAGDGLVSRSFTDLVNAFGSGQAPHLLAVLLLPTLGLALRSPLLLGVIPPLLSRWTSPEPTYWGAEYHYNATITVIVVIALADALSHMDRQRLGRRLLAAGLGTAVVMTFWAPVRWAAYSRRCTTSGAATVRNRSPTCSGTSPTVPASPPPTASPATSSTARPSSACMSTSSTAPGNRSIPTTSWWRIPTPRAGRRTGSPARGHRPTTTSWAKPSGSSNPASATMTSGSSHRAPGPPHPTPGRSPAAARATAAELTGPAGR